MKCSSSDTGIHLLWGPPDIPGDETMCLWRSSKIALNLIGRTHSFYSKLPISISFKFGFLLTGYTTSRDPRVSCMYIICRIDPSFQKNRLREMAAWIYSLVLVWLSHMYMQVYWQCCIVALTWQQHYAASMRLCSTIWLLRWSLDSYSLLTKTERLSQSLSVLAKRLTLLLRQVNPRASPVRFYHYRKHISQWLQLSQCTGEFTWIIFRFVRWMHVSRINLSNSYFMFFVVETC